MSIPKEFSPSPGNWEHMGIKVGTLRKILAEFDDEFVLDAIVIPTDQEGSGKIMAIYPHKPPFTMEDHFNLMILKHAKETTEIFLEMGEKLGWDSDDNDNQGA